MVLAPGRCSVDTSGEWMSELCSWEGHINILLSSRVSAPQGPGQPSMGLEFPYQHSAGPRKCSPASVMVCDVTLHSLSALWDFTPISHPPRESPLFSREALSAGFSVFSKGGLMLNKAPKPDGGETPPRSWGVQILQPHRDVWKQSHRKLVIYPKSITSVEESGFTWTK